MIRKEDYTPKGPWGKTWLLAGALVLTQFVGLELFWRSRGHYPMVTHSPQLWSHHRARAAGAGRETVALVGGSRIQGGFVHEIFREEFPNHEPVQLAVAAKGPFATLDSLAEDDSFRGVVIFSMDEYALQPAHLDDQLPHTIYWRDYWGPGKEVSLWMAVGLQKCLAQLQPRLGGAGLVRWLAKGRLPLVAYVETLFNGRRIDDYSLIQVDQLIKTRIKYVSDDLKRSPPASEEAWRDVVARVASAIAKIKARGGAVACVRYPVRGEMLALQERLLPRARYWDVLAHGVGTDVIHFEAMPGGDDLVCPDGSHLDPPSAAAFTRWLAQELKTRQILE